MSDEEVRGRILRVLQQVAPEARRVALQPAVALRDQLDLDSMDVLNFVTALHDALRVDVPESDYSQLATLDAAVDYLAARVRA